MIPTNNINNINSDNLHEERNRLIENIEHSYSYQKEISGNTLNQAAKISAIVIGIIVGLAFLGAFLYTSFLFAIVSPYATVGLLVLLSCSFEILVLTHLIYLPILFVIPIILALIGAHQKSQSRLLPEHFKKFNEFCEYKNIDFNKPEDLNKFEDFNNRLNELKNLRLNLTDSRNSNGFIYEDPRQILVLVDANVEKAIKPEDQNDINTENFYKYII
jgi:hypothetical protein